MCIKETQIMSNLMKNSNVIPILYLHILSISGFVINTENKVDNKLIFFEILVKEFYRSKYFNKKL